MPGLSTAISGLPGFRSAVSTGFRNVFRQDGKSYIAVNGIIDGTKSRDPGNTDDIDRLRPGLLMGKITTGGKWAPSVFGVTTNAEAQGSTQIETTAAAVTEIVRRIGSTGTLKVTGPPSAAGTVRTLTATYSAASSTNITITALGANQVEDIKFNIASTAGNLQLTVRKTDGTWVTTANAAWNATDATYLSAINSALDTATGVTGGIVASAIPATDTDLGIRLTYSGTGYAGQTWTPAQVNLFPTSSTWPRYEAVTTAVDGRFVAGSLIQPTDGSETILTLIDDGNLIPVTDSAGSSQDQPFSQIPCAGTIISSQIINWPADASLRTYVKQALSSLSNGKFIFDDAYTAVA